MNLQIRISALHLMSGTGIGGSEILALNLAKHHSPQLLNLHIIATGKGVLANELEKSTASFSILKRRAFLDPVLIYRLYRYCKKNEIEIIHCHQLLECLNAYFVARVLRIKLFFTFHGYYYFEKNYIVKCLGKMLAARVNSNFFVSQALKEYYIQKYSLGNIRSEVVYNGTPPPESGLHENDSLRKEYGLSDSDILIGMTGNFSQARNHILVCKVFRELSEKHPDSNRLHLIFIGGIDKEPSPKYIEASNFCMESGLQDTIHFAGQRINAGKLLGNFDIFVYSTHRETFCLSVVEAISAGVPVLVNDLPVMREITEDGILADLYETDNLDDLYAKLSESLLNINQLKEAAKERQKRALRKYSIQNYQERLINMYTSIE